MYQLYGDGIHDDQPAIQQMLDSGLCEVRLPVPKKHYLIGKTLMIPSNCRLCLPRFAEIRLSDGANCFMVQNKVVCSPAPRTHPEIYAHEVKLGDRAKEVVDRYNFFVNDFSPEPDDAAVNIEICGGIWNCNNLRQNPNPQRTSVYEPYGYTGYGMLFYNVRHLTLRGLTMKDPTNFAITLDTVSYFTAEDIRFDFNYGNPVPLNMDGIHVNGNCHFGRIRNLKGACYDDLIALNADEGSFGPISHISISDLFAQDCHSAVRLLTVKNRVEHIHISNVYGSYYQYGIGLTKFYKSDLEGWFDDITLDNLYISKADGRNIMEMVRTELPNWSITKMTPVWIQGNTHVKNLKIDTLHRREYQHPVATIFVGENALVENMILDNITSENHVGQPMPLIENNGRIQHLSATNLRTDGDALFSGKGIVETGL